MTDTLFSIGSDESNTTLWIYCDESCHLEHDHQPNMVLGAIVCDEKHRRRIHTNIQAIKQRHGVIHREIKFQQVSPSKIGLYQELIEFFFNTPELTFRGVVASKHNLNHQAYTQTHEVWYYKMYYLLLVRLIKNAHTFKIFLDVKDIHGSKHRQKLREILGNANYDFNNKLIQTIQGVQSSEVGLVQLTDLFVGILMYANRPEEEQKSSAKKQLVDLVKNRSHYSLSLSTPLEEHKYNLFFWQSQEKR
ncbi:MAG: DUF3800 domain-containing protein [Vampirovibrionales bacterium]